MHDSRRRDGVDADQWCEFDGQLTDKVIGSRLRGVVRERSALGDRSIGRGGKNEIAAKALLIPGLRRLIRHEVGTSDVDVEGECPFVVGDVPAGVTRDEDTGGHTDVIEATVGEGDLVEHGADARAIGDVCSQADRRTTVGESGASDPDADAVLVGDFLGGCLRGRLVEVDADDVGTLSNKAMRGLLTDAGACTNDDHDLPGEFFFRRHTLELGLLQQPILDVECFLLRQRDIGIDGLGTAHHFDRAIVKLSRHAGFGLILAPGNHAQTGDEHHGRVRITLRRGVVVFATRIVAGVVRAIGFETGGELALQDLGTLALRVPVDVKRLDLGPKEMVGATRSQLREAGGVPGIHKPQDLVVILHGADEALHLGNLSPQPRKDGREGGIPLLE